MLLEDLMEECVILDKITVDDDYGGHDDVYVEGASFNCDIFNDSRIEAKLAGVQGVTSVYTITTPKNVILRYHQVFKRKRDGQIFRVTSDGDDKYTPNSSPLNLRQVSAEEWRLPINGQVSGT